MKLKQIIFEGYRCFRNKTEIPFHRLTVLIGENDSGKSTILKGLGLLLDKKEAQTKDFWCINEIRQNSFFIEAEFELTGNEFGDQQSEYDVGGKIYLKKIYTLDQSFKTFIRKNQIDDPELANYSSLNADPTKALLLKYSLPSYPTQAQRQEAIANYIKTEWNNLVKHVEYVEIKFNEISSVLPYFQYFPSYDYGNPQNLIKKTLDSIYTNHFYDESGKLKLKSIRGLTEKIIENLNKKITENLLSKIRLYNSKIVSVRGNIDINFSQGLNFDGLELDEGQGFRLIADKGEGSKKRLFLSILEWDKEVQSGLVNNRSIIRGYDEPDANLHYEAQRKMFYAISEISASDNSKIQNVIATHSISMIDRAPSKSINHVIQTDGASSVQFLKADGDEEIKTFLNQVSEIGGIKNSSIFYEKCLLIVEGQTEEAAIPIIYKRLVGRSMAEDGIFVHNLETNGGWRNVLKFLTKNKSSCTVLILDRDTQNPNCGANVTPERLAEIGFPAVFCSENVFFAGVQEFEDIFPDKRLRDTFNTLYPKNTIGKWKAKDFSDARVRNPKISKELEKMSFKFIAHHKKRFSKPEFAINLIPFMKNNELAALEDITQLFQKISQIIT